MMERPIQASRSISTRCLSYIKQLPGSLVLILAFCGTVGAALWGTYKTQSELVESSVLSQAAHYTQALAEFRTLYTSEVITRLGDQPIEVTHDYATKPAAIPLPATLSILLGERLADHDHVRVQLYSPFPFPWRKASRRLDAFQREALRHLRDHPDRPFFRVETADGRSFMRYASSDLMRPSCVSCHNSHPDSPKTDWQVGELRGVLEIAIPLDAAMAQATYGFRRQLLLLLSVSGIGLLTVATLFRRLRQSTVDLEAAVLDRTRELKESESRVRATVESALDCVICMDHEGRVVEFNPAAETVFGYAHPEMIGERLGERLIPPALRHQHREGLKRYRETGEALVLGQRITTTAMRADGSVFPIELAINVSGTPDKPLFTAYVRDITESQQAQDDLRRAKEQAESANRAKTEFLANMSHELRTPLHGILSFAELGLERAATAPTDHIQHCFQVIVQSGQTLLVLLDNLLDLAKLEAGKTVFTFEPTDLRRLVTQVAAELEAWCRERDLTLEVLAAEPLPEVRLDAEKLRQVCRNLLSNAVKFSPEGGTITCHLHDERESETVVMLISDEGVGIPEEERDSIFDKFAQSSTTRTGAGGTGLGLAICREIVVAHAGRIWAENRPEGGAVFVLELPIQQENRTHVVGLDEAGMVESSSNGSLVDR